MIVSTTGYVESLFILSKELLLLCCATCSYNMHVTGCNMHVTCTEERRQNIHSLPKVGTYSGGSITQLNG